MCFEKGAPIADECRTIDHGHGRLTDRTCRTSQVLHGYSRFPGIHQAAEIESRVQEFRRGKVVKDTTTFSYVVTDLSPREVGAGQLNALSRRHWMAENRHHHIRDNHWNEDRATWRSGDSAFVMFVLLAIALNLLRTTSSRWQDDTPISQRALSAEYALTVEAATLLHRPP